MAGQMERVTARFVDHDGERRCGLLSSEEAGCRLSRDQARFRRLTSSSSGSVEARRSGNDDVSLLRPLARCYVVTRRWRRRRKRRRCPSHPRGGRLFRVV